MEQDNEIVLTYKGGHLRTLTRCPQCGGSLRVHDQPDYLSVSCTTASPLHTGAGLLWSRTLKRYNDTGVPYRIVY
jgi:hypothetical protein